MIHLYDRATMAQVATLDLDPALRALLLKRVATLGEDLIDWTEYLVVEPGDTEEDIVRLVGFSPLVEPIDGVRWPHPAFEPGWDWLVDHGGWFEMTVTFGSAFGYVLFIQNASGSDGDLARLCVRYATVDKVSLSKEPGRARGIRRRRLQ